MLAVIGATVIPLARALGQRIGGQVPAAQTQREVQSLRDEVEQLRGELDAVHHRLGEVDDLQSRLDFAERMLAQGKDKPALPGAR